MKKIIFLLNFLLIAACTKVSDDLIILEVENGVGASKEIKFNVSESTIREIELLNLNETKDVEQLIKNALSFVKGYTSVTLNNPSSYDFIDDSIGSVSVVGDTVKISFNFTAQNGIGNKIISKADLDIYDKNDELQTDIEIQ